MDTMQSLISTLALLEGFTGLAPDDFDVVEIRTRDVTASSGEVWTVLEAEGLPADEGESEDSDWDPWAYESDGWRLTECELLDEDSLG